MQNTLKKAVVATGAMALALSMATATASASSSNVIEKGKGKKVKCYGVAAKGKNDCQTKNHSCAGEAKADNAADEWVYMPMNLCKKLAKSSVGKPRS
ncbi:DUF2282 domain-containing protein [Temperatibacter marinus]|uniref:DUF2282 domain-containing protein n=1 Tax=Temperatibacter marinus TaxID=1456591 RepID=A0AA52H9J6_9PROT|nr:DUF2282 domain-containing protein [Temperatibacter marinus]WND01688.1 DUF2282 domain-containing protein [Temperatibacter marinus]